MTCQGRDTEPHDSTQNSDDPREIWMAGFAKGDGLFHLQIIVVVDQISLCVGEIVAPFRRSSVGVVSVRRRRTRVRTRMTFSWHRLIEKNIAPGMYNEFMDQSSANLKRCAIGVRYRMHGRDGDIHIMNWSRKAKVPSPGENVRYEMWSRTARCVLESGDTDRS